jgi:hypothetical protein
MLCPVRWRTASNWLIVMTAAVPLTETEKDNLIDSDGFPDWDYIRIQSFGLGMDRGTFGCPRLFDAGFRHP